MSRKPEGPIKVCEDCGSEFRVPPSRAKSAKYCSRVCASKHSHDADPKRVVMTCPACRKDFRTFASHLNRRVYCSRACRDGDPGYKQIKRELVLGHKNPFWKGGHVQRLDGYVYRAAPHHPYASNSYVLEHRLVMEQYLRENEPDSPNLIQLGFQRYLSPEMHVHHIDEDKTNNVASNLMCMTPSDHRKHHNAERRRRQAEQSE